MSEDESDEPGLGVWQRGDLADLLGADDPYVIYLRAGQERVATSGLPDDPRTQSLRRVGAKFRAEVASDDSFYAAREILIVAASLLQGVADAKGESPRSLVHASLGGLAAIADRGQNQLPSEDAKAVATLWAGIAAGLGGLDDDAERFLRAASKEFKRLGDRGRAGRAWEELSHLLHAVGRPRDAADAHRRARKLRKDDPIGLAYCRDPADPETYESQFLVRKQVDRPTGAVLGSHTGRQLREAAIAELKGVLPPEGPPDPNQAVRAAEEFEDADDADLLEVARRLFDRGVPLPTVIAELYQRDAVTGVRFASDWATGVPPLVIETLAAQHAPPSDLAAVADSTGAPAWRAVAQILPPLQTLDVVLHAKTPSTALQSLLDSEQQAGLWSAWEHAGRADEARRILRATDE